MKVRPTGISIIAIALIILGLFSFLWSMFQFGFGGVQALFSMFGVGSTANLWAGLLGMLAGGVQLVTGIGLLGMKSWSWYLAFIGVGLGIIQGVMGLFDGSFLCGAISLIIPVAIAVYLLRPEMRELFGVGTSAS